MTCHYCGGYMYCSGERTDEDGTIRYELTCRSCAKVADYFPTAYELRYCNGEPQPQE